MKKNKTKINYPQNIQKLDELTICSNTINGGGDLIQIQDYIPLIIGSGIVPVIWLNIKIDEKIIQLVSANRSYNRQLDIKENFFNKSIKISVNNTIILFAKMENELTCIVDKIDFRPIGLNIFGDANKLDIAGNTLSRNNISGAKFLIAMG